MINTGRPSARANGIENDSMNDASRENWDFSIPDSFKSITAVSPSSADAVTSLDNNSSVPQGLGLVADGHLSRGLSPLPSQTSNVENIHSAGSPIDPEAGSDGDPSRWIHRDKLLQIERREMQEAGIQPIDTRNTARPRQRKGRAEAEEDYGADVDGGYHPSDSLTHHAPGIRVASPSQKGKGFETHPLDNEFDIRTPEEIAADQNDTNGGPTTPNNRYAGLRSSSSRIPLPRSSPMPLPRDQIDRSAPLSRTRVGSNIEEDISYPYTRSRSNSVGSQMLLDDHGNKAPSSTQFTSTTPVTSPRPQSQGSPNKLRSPSGRFPISPKDGSTHKGRSPSSSIRAPTIRPKSRSGLEPRPPTGHINRPEGEAPWIKEMYAPDPRLPPDEQMLPTHAKKLQQEQWERARQDSEKRQRERDYPAGDEPVEASPTRGPLRQQAQTAPNFSVPSPLAKHTRDGSIEVDHQSSTSALTTQSSHGRLRPSGSDIGPRWPLASPTSVDTPSPLPTPQPAKTTTPSPAVVAGYSTMPHIPPVREPAQLESKSSLFPPLQDNANDFKANAGQEKPSKSEAGKVKGKPGCRCCVVM